MEYATGTSSNDSTPVRRISWKGVNEILYATEDITSEKGAAASAAPYTPAHGIQGTPAQIFDTATSYNSSANYRSDIESQSFSDYTSSSSKASWREMLTAYTILFVVIVFYLLLVVGVMVLTDWLFPGVLQLYHKLKELGAELANTTFELAGLKTQLSLLYQSINRVSPI